MRAILEALLSHPQVEGDPYNFAMGIAVLFYDHREELLATLADIPCFDREEWKAEVIAHVETHTQ